MSSSKSVVQITPKSIPITIYLSPSLNFGVTAGEAVDVKSNGTIEISDPNNPKNDTHNDISVIFFDFGVTAGGG